jgi:hypothetical protein
MVVRTKIEPLAKTISLIVNSALSPAAQSQAVADFARSAIADADEANRRILGRVPPKKTTVDGREGAALESVNPDGGSIITEWELIGDLLFWIGDTLRARSPIVSGHYRDAHTLFADSVEVPIGGDVPSADEYVFLNPLPYARKIEIGKTKSGRDFVVSVPNRIYERTANDAKAKFGNLANIRFSYRGTENSEVLEYVPINRHVVRNRKGRFVGGFSTGNHAAADHERSLRVPAIVVTLKAA